jgi:hypothetical protein
LLVVALLLLPLPAGFGPLSKDDSGSEVVEDDDADEDAARLVVRSRGLVCFWGCRTFFCPCSNSVEA